MFMIYGNTANGMHQLKPIWFKSMQILMELSIREEGLGLDELLDQNFPVDGLDSPE